MKFSIEPIKAKITDVKDSDVMNIYINGDTGEACNFVYNIGYMDGEQKNAAFSGMIENTAIQIRGEDYAAYVAASTSHAARFSHAASVVVVKFPILKLAK